MLLLEDYMGICVCSVCHQPTDCGDTVCARCECYSTTDDAPPDAVVAPTTDAKQLRLFD
jgi:hypothetical protein